MIDIGLSKKDRKLISDALSCILSDTYIIYVKTQGFSWNVKGEGAYNLQILFMEQANEFLQTINRLARRIRALDEYVPSAIHEYIKLSSLHESKQHIHEPHDMIRMLILDNEFLVRRSHDVYDIANATNDPVTRHLMQERMQLHSENAWKMRMHLE